MQPSPRRRFVSTRTKLALTCSLALSLAGQAARAQTTYNFTGAASTTVGANGSLWSNPANWTPSTGYPGSNGSATTDNANLTDTTANRIVNYDTGASGYLGALNITETSGFNNEVVFLGSAVVSTGTNTITSVATPYLINTWQIAQNITLAASGAGSTSTFFINSYGDPSSTANTTNGTGGRQLTLKIGTTGGGTMTINAGGVLEVLPGSFNTGNGGNVPANITGNIVLNSGGILNSDRAVFPAGTGAGISQVSGSLTMTGGTINLSAPNSLGLALPTGTTTATAPASDNRLYFANLQVSGGTINQLTGGTSSAASTTLNQTSIYAQGTTNFLVNATFNTGTFIELASSGGTQTFYSNIALNNIVTRNFSGSAATPSYGLKTIGAATVNGTTVTANSAGTLVMGQFQFGDAISFGNTALQLASNVTEKSGSLLPNRQQTGTSSITTNDTINVAGFTYDLTQVLQTSSNNNGIFSLTTANNGAATATTSGVAINGTFNVTSSLAGGVIKATGFDLSGGGTGGSVNVADLSYTGTAATNFVTLNASGGNGTANNLGGSASTTFPAVAISATSTFLYSGAAVLATPATLVSSNRTIGILAVTTGALNIAQAALTTGGAVTVNGGGTLALNGTGYGTLTLGAGNFAAANSTLSLTLGANLDQIAAGGTGQSFSLDTVTIAINGTASASTYQVFTGFTGTNTVANVSFTGVPSGETASIDTTGLITFSAAAVPEPGTWVGGVLLLGALATWGRRRQPRPQAARSL